MKKRIIGFIMLTCSILLLIGTVFSSGHQENKKRDEIHINRTSTCVDGYSNRAKVQDFIANAEANPDALSRLLEDILRNNNYELASGSMTNEDVLKLGLEEVQYSQPNSFSTKDHIDVFRLSQDSEFRYQWTNTIENGSIRMVIMDKNKNIFYENNQGNVSEQDRISLPVGDYFIFVEITCEAVGIIKYDLLFSEDK